MAAFWVAAFSLESLQNSLRRNWMLKQPLFLLTGCLSIHFFDSPPIFLTQLVRPPLLLTGCHATPAVTGTFHPPFIASATDLRGCFLLSHIFYLLLLPAAFKASLRLAVQPQRWQGFVLIFET